MGKAAPPWNKGVTLALLIKNCICIKHQCCPWSPIPHHVSLVPYIRTHHAQPGNSLRCHGNSSTILSWRTSNIPIFRAARTPPALAAFIHLLTPLHELFSSQFGVTQHFWARHELAEESHTALGGARLAGALMGLFHMQICHGISIP